MNNQGFIGKKTLLACALSAAALSLPNQTIADERNDLGLYVGGNYGVFKSRGGDFDDENDFFEAVAGLKFLPFLGVEGSYANFGEYGGDLASAELHGFGLAAVGYLPLSRSASLYAKVGQFFSEVDVEVADFEDDFSDEQLFFGVGANFTISDPLTLSVEYDRFKVDVEDDDWPIDVDDSDTDIDMLKVGLKFMF